MNITAAQLAHWIIEATRVDNIGPGASVDLYLATLPAEWRELVRAATLTGDCDFFWWAESQQSQE